MCKITTTGTLASVVLEDLGNRTLVHPVTNYDLETEYPCETLRSSQSLGSALDAGYVTVSFSGYVITTAIEFKKVFHYHPNKTLLDTYTQTEVNLADVVSKKHTQNSDIKLNEGGANEVTAAQAKTAYTHSQVVSGNPHGTVKSDIGLGNVPNTDATLRSNHTGTQTLSTISDAGTSASKNVPSSGDASSTEVVKGNDSRLTDSRVPSGTAGGDLTGTYPNPTIGTNKVTNSQSAQMSTKTYKGRTSAGTGNAEDVAVATLKTDLVLVKADVGLGNVVNSDTTTTANITDSTNKRFITDAQQTVLGNTSGTNSGNETTTTEGVLINGATSKTTPVDADQVGLMDSAASNILKKLSWSNIKATLKTYFDTLYQVILVSGTNIKTINGSSVLGSGDLIVTGAAAVVTQANNSTTDSSSSTTYALLTGMSNTPVSGNYIIQFDGYGVGIVNSSEGQIALFIGGIEQTDTQRLFGDTVAGASSKMKFPVSTLRYATVNGSQAIEIKFKANAGTVEIRKKTLILTKV